MRQKRVAVNAVTLAFLDILGQNYELSRKREKSCEKWQKLAVFKAKFAGHFYFQKWPIGHFFWPKVGICEKMGAKNFEKVGKKCKNWPKAHFCGHFFLKSGQPTNRMVKPFVGIRGHLATFFLIFSEKNVHFL